MTLRLLAECDVCRHCVELDLRTFDSRGPLPVPPGWFAPGFDSFVCTGCLSAEERAALERQTAERPSKDVADLAEGNRAARLVEGAALEGMAAQLIAEAEAATREAAE
ncbi:MAG: hypothetical protein KGL39_41320 [Patescibacteria group bacterium]|nr:hypothetical protein [Patescibacteria group bacterium]